MSAKPIIFFDTETTGTDLETARIVEIATSRVDPGTMQILERKCILINPGIPIPKSASDIHGITDEKVAGEPMFFRYAKALHNYFSGCDVAGFNVIEFDVPILAAEFSRCGMTWPADDTRFMMP
jgi:DNA polymerase-3 subunit epsilon